MERSQDEIMNSNDSARDSQGSKTSPLPKIVTRSSQLLLEEPPSKTFAILKNVKAPNPAQEESKENSKRPPEPPSKPASDGDDSKSDSKYNIFPSDASATFGKRKSEKGYKCLNCERCYNARRNLVRHVTLECGREPQYKCPHCACSKHRRNELKNHINKKHPHALGIK